MRGFVFVFDALLGLLSLVYILSFVLATASPGERFLLDLSESQRVSDFLLVTHLADDYDPLAHRDLLGTSTCSPPAIPCDAREDWVCLRWMESRAIQGRIVLDPRVVCVEAFS